MATGAAYAALRDSWRAQRLPDSLPQFIVGTSTDMAPRSREGDRPATWPSRRPACSTPTPATPIAFAPRRPSTRRASSARPTRPRRCSGTSRRLSRQVTRLSYEKDQALPIQDANLVDTETYLRETSALRATRALSERYFGGVSTLFHPISIGLADLQPLLDPDAGLAELRSAQERMKAVVNRARYAQKQQKQIGELRFNAENALVLLTAGFAIEPARFGLKAATRGAANEAIATLEVERQQSGAPLVEYSARAGARLRAALRQLNSPSQARRIADAPVLQGEVARLVPALEVLAPALPLLQALGGKLSPWQMLLVSRGHQADPAKVDAVIDELAGELRGLVGQVSRCVAGVSYPFAHAPGSDHPRPVRGAGCAVAPGARSPLQ